MSEEETIIALGGLTAAFEKLAELFVEALTKAIEGLIEALKPLMPYIRHWAISQRVKKQVYQRNFQLDILRRSYTRLLIETQ